MVIIWVNSGGNTSSLSLAGQNLTMRLDKQIVIYVSVCLSAGRLLSVHFIGALGVVNRQKWALHNRLGDPLGPYWLAQTTVIGRQFIIGDSPHLLPFGD